MVILAENNSIRKSLHNADSGDPPQFVQIDLSQTLWRACAVLRDAPRRQALIAACVPAGAVFVYYAGIGLLPF